MHGADLAVIDTAPHSEAAALAAARAADLALVLLRPGVLDLRALAHLCHPYLQVSYNQLVAASKFGVWHYIP